MAINTIAASANATTFKDPNGATIAVPAEQLALYATIKTEQLAVLNSLIADQAAGFQIELSEKIMASLAGLAGELAHTANALVLAMTERTRMQ